MGKRNRPLQGGVSNMGTKVGNEIVKESEVLVKGGSWRKEGKLKERFSAWGVACVCVCVDCAVGV